MAKAWELLIWGCTPAEALARHAAMCERAAAAGEPAMSLPCYLEWLDTRFDPADAWVADYESAANELMEDAAALAALIAEDAD